MRTFRILNELYRKIKKIKKGKKMKKENGIRLLVYEFGIGFGPLTSSRITPVGK